MAFPATVFYFLTQLPARGYPPSGVVTLPQQENPFFTDPVRLRPRGSILQKFEFMRASRCLIPGGSGGGRRPCCLIHRRSCCISKRSILIHPRNDGNRCHSCLVHSGNCLIHKRSNLIHKRSNLIHKRSSGERRPSCLSHRSNCLNHSRSDLIDPRNNGSRRHSRPVPGSNCFLSKRGGALDRGK